MIIIFLLLSFPAFCGGLPLDIIESCSSDNWGMPHQDAAPFTTSYEAELLPSCQNQFLMLQPMSAVLENAMANFYKDNDAYDKFDGLDLIPENHHLFSKFSPWASHLKPASAADGQINAASCEAPQSDGSTWSVTRIGPFRTTVGLHG